MAILLGSLAGVLILIIGVGAVVLLNQEGSRSEAPPSTATQSTQPPKATPASIEAKLLFSEVAPRNLRGIDYDSVSTEGSWATATRYISGGKSGVTGYDAVTGEQKWVVPFTGGICKASEGMTGSGWVAVMSNDTWRWQSACTRLTVIDLKSGRKVWEKRISSEVAGHGLLMTVAVTDGVIAVGWEDGSMGFQTATGDRLWSKPPPGCLMEAHTSGPRLLSLSICRNGRSRVQERDLRSGKTIRTYRLPPGIHNAWIVSTDPVVLGVATKSDLLDADRLVIMADNGKVQATIDIGKRYVAGCGQNDGTCAATVVTKDTLYISTTQPDREKPSAIVAFDVKTGKRKWASKTPVSPGLGTMIPLRTEGEDGLIAYLEPMYKHPGRVVHIAADGTQKTLLMLPMTWEVHQHASGLSDAEARSLVRYEHGRLYLHDIGPFDNSHPKDELVTMAFGPP
ncbi:outer membrane protein assembly factor BamB family protein [Sinosporangium siamense]|uniref:Pyrrolo-quinoline quinone repeat domain-containing protein n=1 Tax=Sinosporangium siamense TaxID=1367973 RepID=A0A919RJA7_9ACTN|nr:PQQ-binding-like beta-propeller repeat protein [Sinosporangium siamense]GII94673.1 hypothetical protein Ssi02_49040 [Sinosporangium siamense]